MRNTAFLRRIGWFALCLFAFLPILEGQDQQLEAMKTLAKKQDYDGLIAYAENWWKELAANPKPDAKDLATSVYYQGFGHLFKMELVPADSLFRAAIEIWEKARMPETADLAQYYYRLAIINSYQQKHIEAKKNNYRAYQLYVKNLGAAQEKTLRALSNYCASLGALNEDVEGDKTTIILLKTAEVAGLTNYDFYIASLSRFAKSMVRQNRFSSAVFYQEKAVSIARQVYGEENLEFLYALIELGDLFYYWGKYAQAEPLLQQGVAICRKMYQNDDNVDMVMVFFLLTLGNVRAQLGLNELAIKDIQEAQKLTQKIQSENSPTYFRVTESLALMHSHIGNHKLACLEADKIIDYLDRTENPPYDGFSGYLNMAAMYAAANKLDKAETSLEKFEQKNGDPSKFDGMTRTNWLIANAKVLSLKNKLPAAIVMLDSALQFQKEIAGNYSTSAAFIWQIKADMFLKSENFEQYSASLLECANIERQLFLSNLPVLPDNERQLVFNYFRLKLNLLNSAVFRHPELQINSKLVDLQLFAKNILESTTRKTIDFIQTSNDSELLENYQDWLDKRELLNLSFQYHAAETPENTLKTDRLQTEVDSIEKIFLLRGVPTFRTAEFSNLQQIGQSLSEEEAAVDVLRFFLTDGQRVCDTAIYAFSIIKPGVTQPKIIFLENGNDLESFVIGQYQNEITRKKDLSPILFEKMWAPVAAHLQGVKTLYFSPDGIFHKINLNTLRAADGTYLLDNIEIKQVTNLRNILDRGNDTSGIEAGIAALFGNPAFKTEVGSNLTTSATDLTARTPLYRDITKDSKGDFHLNPLPGSEREVNGIAKKLTSKNWQSLVFTGAQATEDTLKKLKSPKVLHVATHGYFLNSEKTSSSNRLTSPHAGKNPALRSMLFFAGAENSIAEKNTGPNDGILTAFEAAVLNLDQTELVVLSACNTGLGKIQNGEGVFGLQRAFRIAGAKSLIMSLWEVEDAATELLMNTFYENWLSGMSKSEAFRKAQVTLKAKYPQPFYWGSFILVNG